MSTICDPFQWKLAERAFLAGVWICPLVLSCLCCAAELPEPHPLAPGESLRAWHVREGFQMELVAAEPLVLDPVAIDWGADGRLWVVEMADYPLGMEGRGEPGGRVRVLEDADGDGRYDKATLFADGLNFPTGILTWRKGVLVTAAPEILYLEDSDGDGRADVKSVLYAGFLEGNQQLRLNSLRWGLDNWVYCAGGGHHGNYGANNRVKSLLSGEAIQLGSRDFRIRPDTGELDPQAGPSQYGRNRDDWGNWFGVQNSHPLWHYVLADHYTRRNPHVAPPDARRQLMTPANPKIYPVTSQKRFHSFEQSGRFTSACSSIVYRDELLFPRDEQHHFVCEPFHNIVHHEIVTPDGVSFQSRRDAGEQTSEFLASEDRWTRPVMVRSGPDGALWVVDMYRYMIEHPQWLPDAGKDELRPYYRSGDDRGRIYRVFPESKPPRPIPRLERLSINEIVAALESPSGTVRDKAQQLLIWRGDQTAIPALQRLAQSRTHPLARLQALCTLDGLDALAAELVAYAMADDHPGVRRHAVRLAEPRAGEAPQLIAEAVRLVTDPDAKVRQQLAYTLGEWDDPQAAAALGELALADSDDPFLMAAVMSSLNPTNLGGVLVSVLKGGNAERRTELAGRLLGLAASFGDEATMVAALEQVMKAEADKSKQFDIVARMLDALAHRNKPLPAVLADVSKTNRAVAEELQALITHAREVAADSDMGEAACRLLLRDPSQLDADIDMLRGLLAPQTSAGLQSAVVERLGESGETRGPEILLEGWKSHSPALRGQILAVLASRPEWLDALLKALESGHVLAADFDAAARQSVLQHPDQGIRKRAAGLFADTASRDRKQVVREFQTALKLSGDRMAGADLFKKKCANCHKLDGVGHEIGPNLASLTNKSPETLLVSILDPSRAVEAKYLNYIAITDDGRSTSGVIVSETGNSMTLAAPEGKQTIILRNSLEHLQSTGKSMMPDGLEKDLSPQNLADLLTYLATLTRRVSKE